MLTIEELAISQGGFGLTAEFQIPTGARVAILGPSGAGKSTFLGAIAGFVAHRGRVLWQGAKISDLPPGKRPVATLFQDNNLFPHLTVAQNVGLGLNPSLRLNRDQRARVADALARVGLQGLADRKPAALSGGQQGRVALARVLLQSRPLILLDEPFAALGPALRRDMLDLIATLADETRATILMVSHNIDDARQFATHVIWLDDGVVQPPRETAAFFSDPPEGLARYA